MGAYEAKRVVVTGSSSGIGQAVASQLANEGAEVVGLDINQPTTRLAQFVRVDLADEASIDEAVRTIGGPVNALFNCAGLSGAHPAMTVLLVNFVGLRRLTEALVPQMPAGSAIANVASLAGAGYEENLAAIWDFLARETFDDARTWCEAHPEQFERGGYGFSKQALIVYTKKRCVDLASRGIRINSTGPGVTDTPMLVGSAEAISLEALDAVPKPLGRRSNPVEQARVLLFLNGDDATYLTGENLWTDGGCMAGRFAGDLPPLGLGAGRRSSSS
jgi:NAD(P)-dependent dehydrogenase (short-subunit alcohol dehydrogenase family)